MADENTPQDVRFSGVIADDYDATFRLVCPHLDQLEQSVADAFIPLRQGIQNRNLKLLDIGSGDGLTSRVILDTI